MTSDSRRRLVWLIGSRVVVSTLLLGSAVVFQVNAPGTLAVDPFFFLIGLTYGLSVIYALTLRFIDRSPWLVTLQFTGRRRRRHGVHSLHRRHHQLLPAAVRAAHSRRGRGADAPGRASRRADERVAVQRARAASVRGRIGVHRRRVDRGRAAVSATDPRGVLHRSGQCHRVCGCRAVVGIAGRAAAARRRPSGGGLDGAGRPAGLQRTHHRKPDERPHDDRPRRTRREPEPGGRADHGPARPSSDRTAGRRNPASPVRVCRVARCRTGRRPEPARRLLLSNRRWKPSRDWPERGAPCDT